MARAASARAPICGRTSSTRPVSQPYPRCFSGRNIVSTVEDQDQLNSLSMTFDAYRALDVLAAHPRIRPDRIAVWGFSKGAVPALYSAVERFRKSFGSANHFAAHVGFYTPCNITYDNDTKLCRCRSAFFTAAATTTSTRPPAETSCRA